MQGLCAARRATSEDRMAEGTVSNYTHAQTSIRYAMAIAVGLVAFLALSLQPWLSKAAPVELQLNVTAVTGDVESDWTSVYYSTAEPLLLGNDGTPDRGGFHAFSLDAGSPLPEASAVAVGRTKLATAVHGVGGKDYALTIAQPDSIIRAYELPGLQQVGGVEFKALGDWSALCSWKSRTGNQYLYLFGKKQGVQYLVQSGEEHLEVVEIQSFPVPFEASGCAVSDSLAQIYLSTDDSSEVYTFALTESTNAPDIVTLGEADDDVTGLAVYVSGTYKKDYILVALEASIAVYSHEFELLGTLSLAGLEELEIQGLSVYQAALDKYQNGVVAFAAEAEDFKGFAVASLEGVLEDLGINPHTEYDPRHLRTCAKKSPICDECSGKGYCLNGSSESGQCQCFAGSTGDNCQEITCTNDCSGRGQCIGPNVCKCDAGWGGLACAFLVVEPSYETDTTGGLDGDDPAIWISPTDRDQSRIITTIKSEVGAGLGVFDLSGKLVQSFSAGEPNNVDVIYSFHAGNRTVDLAFAACREDDTLCLFEILANGTLTEIRGGIQPVVEDYTVYGSCVYRSRKSGKQYLFVNEKSARYLQYELTATSDGTLETTLVRDFQGGSGGQVEGCVTDEENGWLILGEEPSALWKYGAEPDASDEGELIAKVGDGKLYGDVEGVTLIQGATPDKGFIIVSCQGVSAYNIYRRAAPHDYVMTFTIGASADGQHDAVSNTDGVAAVGAALGGFSRGLLVAHDDANELPDGTTSAEATFKIVDLESVLGAEALRELNLLDEVDADWDPRA
ncbi:3-phytase [Paramyrothecium foliicola]|nr:3-phytase [Paramyrothecium foliicola]